jgi:hypothetical protein
MAIWIHEDAHIIGRHQNTGEKTYTTIHLLEVKIIGTTRGIIFQGKRRHKLNNKAYSYQDGISKIWVQQLCWPVWLKTEQQVTYSEFWDTTFKKEEMILIILKTDTQTIYTHQINSSWHELKNDTFKTRGLNSRQTGIQSQQWLQAIEIYLFTRGSHIITQSANW